MRRLLFNPLAQQPYASGELNKAKDQFLIDKKLEKGHLYIAQLFNVDIQEASLTIIDLTNPKTEVSISPVFVSDQNDNITDGYLLATSKHELIDFGSIGSTISYNFVIYLYKVF